MKQAYIKFINEQNLEGSGRASSYIRALNLLNIILSKPSALYPHKVDFWSIHSIDEINKLYEYALKWQKTAGSEFLQPGLSPSYGRNGYYSAALKSYKDFLILQGHEERLWKIYDNPNIAPGKLSELLSKEKIDSIEELVPDKIDISTKEGKEVLRSVKTRVNQNFFRKMILSAYNNQCCITGLNIPTLLIASHIKPWAKDKANRLNPCNGLCLNSLHDKAFDSGLITIDSDRKIVISKEIKEHYSIKAVKTYFEIYDNKMITLPSLFFPDKQFIEYHRNKIFQR